MTTLVNLRNVHGADQPRRDLFVRATDNLQRAINHPTFNDLVLTADYEEILFKPRKRSRVTKTPQDVLQAILGGIERDTSVDNELEIEIRLDGSLKKPTTGSTITGLLPWRTADWFVDACLRGNDSVNLARHLMHEWLHVAGFVHFANTGERKDPPYLVGKIVRTLLSDKTIAPDAHEDPEVFEAFEAATEEVIEDGLEEENGTTTARHLHVAGEDLEARDKRDSILKVYDQTCSTWRQLVDVRFKLLALVPITSVGSLITTFLSSARDPKFPAAFIASFAAIGLTATVGLWIYDRRNSELHKELISFAQNCEMRLGLEKGAFRGRSDPRFYIDHRTGVALVYLASLLAWILVAIFAFAR